MVEAYKEVLRKDTLAIPLELGGMAILFWLLVGGRLYRPDRLLRFLRTGRLPATAREGQES